MSEPFDWGKFLSENGGSIASGILGAISGVNGTSDSVVTPTYLPGQKNALIDAIAAARSQFGQGPMSYYPNGTVAEPNAWIKQGWADQMGSTDNLQKMANASAIGALSLAGGGDKVGGFQLPDQIGFGIPEEYQNAIMSPIMRQLNEQIIPGIHTAATAQGAFGGSRMQQQKADAATQATEAATDAMIRGNLDARQQSIGQRAGDISAQLSGRGQDITQNKYIMDNRANGINAIGTAMNQQLAPGQVMTDVGYQRQKFDQQLLDADVNRFNWNRDERINYIDRLFNRMNGSATGTTTQQGQNGSWLDGLIGFMSGSNMWNGSRATPATNYDPETQAAANAAFMGY